MRHLERRLPDHNRRRLGVTLVPPLQPFVSVGGPDRALIKSSVIAHFGKSIFEIGVFRPDRFVRRHVANSEGAAQISRRRDNAPRVK